MLRNSELLTADLLQLDAVLLSDSCERSRAVKTLWLAVAGASSHTSDQQASRVIHLVVGSKYHLFSQVNSVVGREKLLIASISNASDIK